VDELDRAREDLRTISRIGREAQRGHRSRDVAIADMVRIAGRDRRDVSPHDPPTGEEVLSAPAIADDLRAGA
jgi:hypothetical protein